MFSPTEVLILAVYVLGLLLVRLTLLSEPMPGRSYFLAAYLTALGAKVFTVAEGFLLGYWFDLLEHLFVAATGILMLVAVLRFFGESDRTGAELGRRT